MYAQKIEGDSWLGEKIDKGKIDKMSGRKSFPSKRQCGTLILNLSDQQLGQLYELMQAIQKKSCNGSEGDV